jgi:hypothetical protein
MAGDQTHHYASALDRAFYALVTPEQHVAIAASISPRSTTGLMLALAAAAHATVAASDLPEVFQLALDLAIDNEVDWGFYVF